MEAIYSTSKSADNIEYGISVYDKEPYGLAIACSIENKTIRLDISEANLFRSGFRRSLPDLQEIVNTLSPLKKDGNWTLTSTNQYFQSELKISSKDLVNSLMSTSLGNNETFQKTLIKGLVELCKAKPKGEDAVLWLGEWLLENNPNQPKIEYDEQ